MSKLIIPKHIFDEMISHCEAGLPNEACGILAGKGNEASEIYTMSNNENSSVSYLMDPAEQFKAIKAMREKKLDMLGIFHSHPSSPACPSQKDVDLAFYEDAVYVIVSLVEERPAVKAFSIVKGGIREIELVVKKSD
ncbi:MAG TPA: M67 family metallopeptidase [Thermodesulfovibrionales bacterium]|nr:M67 family metallopeptidase [Thermodesulfovibrionales bacterium]